MTGLPMLKPSYGFIGSPATRQTTISGGPRPHREEGGGPLDPRPRSP